MREPCPHLASRTTPAGAASLPASISVPPQAMSASPAGARMTMTSVEHTALFRRRPGLISLMDASLTVRENCAGHAAGHERIGQVLDLVRGRSAQLPHRLRDVVHAVDVSLADQATVGVHRQRATDLYVATLHEVLRLALAAEPEGLQLLEHLRGEGVVD